MDEQNTVTTSPLLSMRGIVKRFPGVLALNNVDFDVSRGEVHALIGENGAGKSTLMKILSGVYTADAGETTLRGQRVSFTTPRQAQDAGIAMIHQELNLIPYLTVTENIFMGSEILRRGGLLNWPEMHKQAHALLAKLHLDIDPHTPVARLGVAQQQMVEVAKSLHYRADLIIMDEPTSALSLHEIDDLFAIIRDLKANNVSVIYISHHLDEAFVLSDRITVLRDGRHIATQPIGALNMESLIRLMVGRDLSEQFPKEVAPVGDEALRVEGLTRGARLQDVSFSVRAGEILAIAGLVGAGRTELVRAIFGADRIDSGRIYVNGREVKIRSPQDAIRAGIGLLTEDRKQQGLILKMSVRHNVTLATLKAMLRGGLFIDHAKEAQSTAQYVQSIAIKASSQEQLVINLSGGNQQKVVLSKWLATAPRILIFDEPTRGIDVGAKVEIYKLMNQLAAQGVAILMVSSEMPEVLGMADRILVLCQGRVSGFLTREEATQERIMELAAGIVKTAP